MKLKFLLYLLLVLFVPYFTYAQNFDVVYKGIFKPNKNDKAYVEEDIFMLHIRGNKSLYYSINYQKMMTNQEEAVKNKIDIGRISSNYIITKEGDKVVHHQAMISAMMNYEEKELPKWKILKEYKEIDSMKCQKATAHFRGRNYIAWFSNEVPVSEGPYKFKNLPGLIVEIASTDGDFKYALASLKKNDEEIDEVPSVPLKDRKQYLQMMKKIKENPTFSIQQEDMASNFKQRDFIDGKEVSQSEKYRVMNEKIWEFMKTHNNPIETDDIWIR